MKQMRTVRRLALQPEPQPRAVRFDDYEQPINRPYTPPSGEPGPHSAGDCDGTLDLAEMSPRKRRLYGWAE